VYEFANEFSLLETIGGSGGGGGGSGGSGGGLRSNRSPTGLARDGSPFTVFGSKMGTEPPLSAEKRIPSTNNNNNSNNNEREPLTYRIEERFENFDEAMANEHRDESAKLLAEIAKFLEETAKPSSIKDENKKDQKKRKTPKKTKDEDDVMMTPPPSSIGKNNNKSNANTPNTQQFQIRGGLKSFAMKVCEKVKERGTTTYDEVSDALIAEVLAEREAEGNPLITCAADDDGLSSPKKKNTKQTNTTNKKRAPTKVAEKKASSRANETVDEKNIRRRVYDALNVLSAIDVVSRGKEDNKKIITWHGIPAEFGDASMFGDLAAPPLETNRTITKKEGTEREKTPDQEEEIGKGITDEERAAIEKENNEGRERVRKKALYLAELTEQFDALCALVQRNERIEREELDKKKATAAAAYDDDDDDDEDKDNGSQQQPEGIQLPFILVQTDRKATVEVEISEDQRVVHIDFNESPFQVFDGNFVLRHTEGIKQGIESIQNERTQRLGIEKYDESVFQPPPLQEEEDDRDDDDDDDVKVVKKKPKAANV